MNDVALVGDRTGTLKLKYGEEKIEVGQYLLLRSASIDMIDGYMHLRGKIVRLYERDFEVDVSTEKNLSETEYQLVDGADY